MNISILFGIVASIGDWAFSLKRRENTLIRSDSVLRRNYKYYHDQDDIFPFDNNKMIQEPEVKISKLLKYGSLVHRCFLVSKKRLIYAIFLTLTLIFSIAIYREGFYRKHPKIEEIFTSKETYRKLYEVAKIVGETAWNILWRIQLILSAIFCLILGKALFVKKMSYLAMISEPGYTFKRQDSENGTGDSENND